MVGETNEHFSRIYGMSFAVDRACMRTQRGQYGTESRLIAAVFFPGFPEATFSTPEDVFSSLNQLAVCDTIITATGPSPTPATHRHRS